MASNAPAGNTNPSMDHSNTMNEHCEGGQGGQWWVGWWVAGFDPVAFTL